MVSVATPHVFAQISGHRGLDLVNTVAWRLAPRRRRDDLRSFEDVLVWSLQTRLLDEGELSALHALAARATAEADQELARVLGLRESLHAVLLERADPAAIAGEYSEAISASHLEASTASWSWKAPKNLALPRRLMALDALDLLTCTELGRLRRCEDAACGWVFLDTSPRHNRRWCVAAGCGNRNRAREFYQRSRAI